MRFECFVQGSIFGCDLATQSSLWYVTVCWNEDEIRVLFSFFLGGGEELWAFEHFCGFRSLACCFLLFCSGQTGDLAVAHETALGAMPSCDCWRPLTAISAVLALKV